MDIPPIIPESGGQSSVVPPKPPVVVPKQNAPRRAMTPKQMIRIALVAGLCLLVVVGAGVYEYNRFCAPRNSILALASAMQRRDRETVEEYVDAPALAESFRKRALE